MLKKAVKLLRGSVCVRAKSAYPERMLNLCSARGIEFWDVRWIDDTALSFCVARGDLRALQSRFGYTVEAERGKPTNRAFLAQICEHLRLRRMDAQEETYPS